MQVIIINTRHFKCFIALAEELNFRKAAEKCLITQPALSHIVKQLEQELDTTLVFRNNRHVRLTQSGEVFLVKAREFLAQLHDTTQLIQRIEKGKAGVLVIGATIPAMYTVLSEIIVKMKNLLPEVEVIVHAMDTSEQENNVSNGRIDIGIGHPPFEDLSLASTIIARIPFSIVMSVNNSLSREGKLTMKNLADQTFILFPRKLGPLQYDSIISTCLELGFSPKNIVEISPAQAIIAFAASGIGIGFIASKLQQFPHPNVVYRQIEGNMPYFTLGIVHRSYDINPAIEAFKVIAQEVGRLV